MPELAKVRLEQAGAVTVACLEGEIDASNAGVLLKDLQAGISNTSMGLVIDLRPIGHVDSSGIHLFVVLRTALERRGQRLRLVAAPGSFVAEVLEVSGLLGLVAVDESVEQALEAM